MKLELIIQNNPPADVGVGIYNNFSVYMISLLFADLLLNLKEQELLIGIGIPFVKAVTFSLKW